MTAVDVCYSVYGEGGAATDTVDNYYEPNASTSIRLLYLRSLF